MYYNEDPEEKQARKLAYCRFVGELVYLADRADNLLYMRDGGEYAERPLEHYGVKRGQKFADKIQSRRWYLGGRFGLGVQAYWAVNRSLQILKNTSLNEECRVEYTRILALLNLARLNVEPYRMVYQMGYEGAGRIVGQRRR